MSALLVMNHINDSGFFGWNADAQGTGAPFRSP
jgi:hypothetical protein